MEAVDDNQEQEVKTQEATNNSSDLPECSSIPFIFQMSTEEDHFQITYMIIFVDYHFQVMLKKMKAFMNRWDFVIYQNLTKFPICGEFQSEYNKFYGTRNNKIPVLDIQAKYETMLRIESLMDRIRNI